MEIHNIILFVLKNFFFRKGWRYFYQGGFYLDFFLKKNIEVFIRNFFVYSSKFIGEKYSIEFLTKVLIERLLFFFEKLVFWNKLPFMWFFFQIISFIFYFFSIYNLLYIL